MSVLTPDEAGTGANEGVGACAGTGANAGAGPGGAGMYAGDPTYITFDKD